LPNVQKTNRDDISKQLIDLFEKQQTKSWHDIINLDEYWFYFSTDYEIIRLCQEKLPRKRATHDSITKNDDNGRMKYEWIPRH
jgi:hypothetical protein